MTEAFSLPFYDVLIVGGGPAGLTAAIYLRRFRCRVLVVDKGHSRLSLIPVTHNYAGFPEGVPGKELLHRLREQLRRYGAEVVSGEIGSITREGAYFIAEYSGKKVQAGAVVIATGVADTGLPVEHWHEAIASGAVRLCPVCDGYDVMDKRIAVVSSATNPIGHALFMRTFSSQVSLFERGEAVILSAEDKRILADNGVSYCTSPLLGVSMSPQMTPVLHTKDGSEFPFDVLYPMLGETARSELAAALGAETASCGELLVDAYQRTCAPGVYAIGDVVQGLNQIAVATGQAAIAATHLHAELPPHYREAVTQMKRASHAG
ncbi:NAD(P)/FAD-dependent oxidoreductase [Undibacterium sp. TJN25]|uniref:NAD(P)/FAD-dependent oxidoreductase n=1 Tax=Undibacterium sp. TJN25 TaxID=3413056 RepID=UPI003BF3B990